MENPERPVVTNSEQSTNDRDSSQLFGEVTTALMECNPTDDPNWQDSLREILSRPEVLEALGSGLPLGPTLMQKFSTEVVETTDDGFSTTFPRWSDYFSKSVYEMGLGENAHAAINSMLVSKQPLKSIVLKNTLGATEYKVEGTSGVMNPALGAFQKIVAGGISESKKRPLDLEPYEAISMYCRELGVEDYQLVADPEIMRSLSGLIEASIAQKENSAWLQAGAPGSAEEVESLPASEQIEIAQSHLQRFSEAIGGDERAITWSALEVAKNILHNGSANVVLAGEIYRRNGLDLTPPIEEDEDAWFVINVHKEMDEQVTQFVQKNMVGGEKSATQMQNVELLAAHSDISPEVLAEKIAGKLVTLEGTSMLYVLRDLLADHPGAAAVPPVTLALCDFFTENAGYQEDLVTKAKFEYAQTRTLRTVKKFFEYGIFSEALKQDGDFREGAKKEYYANLNAGIESTEVTEFFELQDGELDEGLISGYAARGVTERVLSGSYYHQRGLTKREMEDEQIYSAGEVRAFGDRYGVDEAAQASAEREAILSVLGNSRSSIPQMVADIHKYNIDTADEVLKAEADKRIVLELKSERIEGVVKLLATFDFQDEIPNLQEHFTGLLSNNPGFLETVVDYAEHLPPAIFTREYCADLLEMGASYQVEDSFAALAKLNELHTPRLDVTLARTLDIFGVYADWHEYDSLRELLENDHVSKELAALGVSKIGEPGTEQLRERITDFQGRILRDEVKASELRDNDTLARIYMAKTRVKEAEWGKVDRDEVVDMVARSQAFLRENPELGLRDEYADSELVEVALSKQKEDFTFDEDFTERYNAVTASLLQALENVTGDKDPLVDMVEKVKVVRGMVEEDLKEKLAEPSPDSLREKAVTIASRSSTSVEEELEKLEERRMQQLAQNLQTLESINIQTPADVQAALIEFAKYPEFHPVLREVMFTFALQHPEHADQINRMYGVTNADEPTVQTISDTLNFVDHIVNQEVMDTYFTDRKAGKAFRKVNSVVALSQQLTKMMGEKSDQTLPMKFVPTRGPLLELSGQIADACWASKYSLIAEDFENVTAVTMVANPDSAKEKFVGSALLLEAQNVDGEQFLIVRGLNPIENTINKLDVEDFYQTFMTWADEQAAQMDRDLLVVIDDHAGGSATNRPKLFTHLTQKSKELRQRTLSSVEDTTFNGYNITNDVFEVGDLNVEK